MKHEEFITIPQLAEKIGLSRIEVYRRVKAGFIPHQRAGRVFLIPKEYADGLTGEITPEDKKKIERGVSRVIREYGDVIKKLGDK